MTDDDDDDVREVRLRSEFDDMLALRGPGSLIDFQCAPLGAEESIDLARGRARPDVVLRGFMSVEAFQRRHPQRAPDKYLIMLRCRGVAKLADVKRAFGTDHAAAGLPQPFTADGLVVIEEHQFEAIFPLQYPEALPHFIWLTPIFHPNIQGRNLCTTGRPFAPGTRLADICRMAGQMVQYRNFNPESYLDAEAREWAVTNRRTDRLPVDRRPLVASADERLIIFVDGDPGAAGEPERPGGGPVRSLVEWV